MRAIITITAYIIVGIMALGAVVAGIVTGSTWAWFLGIAIIVGVLMLHQGTLHSAWILTILGAILLFVWFIGSGLPIGWAGIVYLWDRATEPQVIAVSSQAQVTPAPTAVVLDYVSSKSVAPVVNTTGCPQARDLGPWAPNKGLGENFEVTCNEQVCAGTHVQLWWPSGSGQAWSNEEISVLVPAGLSIEVQDGAGRGWEYDKACQLAEIERQIAADNSRRATDTKYYGRVSVDTLIETGLVTVRFDRRTADTSQSTVPVANTGFLGRDGDADERTIGDANYAYLIECWSPVQGICVVPVGESVSGVKGANWRFGSTESALTDAKTKGKPIFIVTDGQLNPTQ